MDLFDLIGPVMIGPSSSHTAGAARIGLTARMLLGEDVKRAEIAFHGSFAKTFRGHGTDRAIVGGLMGMQVDDPRIRDSLSLSRQAGIQLIFSTVNIRGAHPNTVRLTLTGETGRVLTLEAASVGGGLISIRRLDGMNVDFTGKENTLIIHHTDAPGMIAAVSSRLAADGVNIATMQVYRRKAGADAMMVLELDSMMDDAMLEELRMLADVQSAEFLKGRED
ncbi:MAG: L-serine ammonia-lyase, iron-sulfur-dependent subunit beta [Clostridia bacterium]|nr:L-serine ammonia-lyase, iron-sulfur-dependent subunit beta [Clostridia bacterium]